jgi:hypothetical protein
MRDLAGMLVTEGMPATTDIPGESLTSNSSRDSAYF